MRPKSHPVTRLDYSQYLLVSQINFTLTNFAEHAEMFSDTPLPLKWWGFLGQPETNVCAFAPMGLSDP